MTEFCVLFMADPDDNLRKHPHILQSGSKIDDARAENEVAVQHRIGNEGLTLLLQVLENGLVQLIKVGPSLVLWHPEVPWYKPEGGDAELAGDGLQFRITYKRT